MFMGDTKKYKALVTDVYQLITAISQLLYVGSPPAAPG